MKGIARKLFIAKENKEVLKEIQELKSLIKLEIEKIEKNISSSQVKKTLNKLENAMSFLEVYIYIIAVNEFHKSESEFSKLELLTILKDTAEKVLYLI